MKRLLIAAAMATLVASPIHADRRRAVAPGVDALSLEFVDVNTGGSMTAIGNNAWVDVGRISKRDAHARQTHVVREFGLRITRGSIVSYGTARVMARLQSWDGRATVRLDGQPLTTAPVLIDPSAAIGATVVHRLEIDVPDSTPAGPINASVLWEVTSD
jgi:hypothetical protein